MYYFIIIFKYFWNYVYLFKYFLCYHLSYIIYIYSYVIIMGFYERLLSGGYLKFLLEVWVLFINIFGKGRTVIYILAFLLLFFKFFLRLFNSFFILLSLLPVIFSLFICLIFLFWFSNSFFSNFLFLLFGRLLLERFCVFDGSRRYFWYFFLSLSWILTLTHMLNFNLFL